MQRLYCRKLKKYKKKRKKSGYVNREYGLDEIVDSGELHAKKDSIIVEEMHISKLGLSMVVV